MKNKRTILLFVAVCLAVIASESSQAQVSITGPTCVTYGTTYLYTFQGKWDSSATAQLCITGGIITDSGTSCTTGTEFSYAKINWDSASSSGLISLTCLNGKASLSVSMASPLIPGTIDTSVRVQAIDSLTIPALIVCSAASGGSCTSTFSYQWQQSPNDLDWTNIEGATSENLRLGVTVNQNMFYRRKVKENTSGMIDYSNDAVIIILTN